MATNPVGHFVQHDHEHLTQQPRYKAEVASPGTVHEIMREQKEREAALVAEQEKRSAAKRKASEERLKAEKTQTEVRIIHQRLIAKLFAQPAKDWDQRQSELFAVICDWLEAKQ